MKPRTYTGATMAEVLTKIKQDLGRDAVILSTRSTTRGGILGLHKKPYIEITASKQLSSLPPPFRRGSVKRDPVGTAIADGAATPVPLSYQQPAGRPRTQPRPIDNSAANVRMELGAIKGMVSDLLGEARRSRVPDVPEALYPMYQRLVENDVAEQIAEELIRRVRESLPADQLRNDRAARAQLIHALEPMIPDAGPLRIAPKATPTLVAFVGPTGVGKTTTVAKLAANYCLREKKRVGLITIDTYRIAAIEQLKTYAQIINVPLEVAASPGQLKESVARLADREIILIDTAGRSQRDEVKIKELAELFAIVPPDETHLVLAGTSSEGVMSQAIDRFSKLGIDRLILTKLDETIGFGVILRCLKMASAGISYITTGQDVPDDIEIGERRMLARLIAGERQHKPGAAV